MYDVIIIGMGIGGITAGIYGKRAGLNVLMFEKSAPGGMLQKIDKIQNYPGFSEISGPDLALNLFNQVKKVGVPFKFEEVIDVEITEEYKKVITKNGTYEAKNIIVATGRTPKYLGLDNEKDYLGRGLSTCASCDGNFYKGEDVAVVGSGNSALQESLYLANIVNKVYLLHRGVNFKGDDALVERVRNTKNIEIVDGVNIKKINEVEGKIESVTLDNEKTINVKGVFIYIGYKPDTEMFKKLDITNINGDIIVSENFETEIDGLYAIGDCAKKGVYQLVTAASDGCIAVSDIEKIRN
ncbi:MAG: FAD-dependent oxidoreductase [Mycoplasma sp.]|nr:FAD-dependent oxidoreductase [Mycoplasma sp.]MDD7150240.1 FAD-dependent oxidoreductase [Mycoplasma sp.]MDY4544913.1 FAD-dependent oxidoreductase [Bacilli bacterium]MDY4618731.1 FAD-dependent oxidoreductase [Bacilli bacterium]